MSNFTSFILASFSTFTSIYVAYLLLKNWSRFHVTIFGNFLKVVYALLVLLIIITSILISYSSFESYWQDDRLRAVSQFQGIKLGWSKDELYFRNGEPNSIQENDDKNTLLDYGQTGVYLKNETVVKIIYVCQDDIYNSEKVGGISCNDSLDRVASKYGEPEVLSVSEDKLTRIYNYPKFNLSFMLSKSKVIMMGVFDPSSFPKGFYFTGQLKSGDTVLEKSPSENHSSKNENKDLKFDSDSAQLASEGGAEIQVKDELEVDHCAPGLKKSDRLERLALKGKVRETGYQTYSVDKYEISFSGNDVISCR